ncbi:hypothetical protein J31TS4_39630 [Paenibacillus sp. J31TS4]|uniref:hypothetical protein n=1 Tax=Paenibacillus sp. J31TS4 TaxID=2807195 RepID=UPI001B1F1D62|nr:hypothetical protein [Paenibacillus sp. J31TS4]GIP40683.1 hypothetical protein J31TS4_39630 [Paenibacillus sp. J31TS4]
MTKAFLFVGFIIGAVFLQIFLSKKDTPWPGLLLPAITSLLSIMAALGLFLYLPMEVLTEQSFKTILNAVQLPKLAALLEALYIVFLYNIPTAFLLCIYYAYRAKLKRNKEIVRMCVQDLG